jgi:Glycosyl transferase family 11
LITSVLRHGLSNRMVQISHVYIKSKLNNVDYFFDDIYCHTIEHKINYHYKNNIFSKLNFNYNIKSETEINKYNNLDNIINYIKNNTILNIVYPYEIWNDVDNFIIVDILWDIKYFYNYQKELCDLFINEEVINEIRIKYNKYLNNSVSLNIRRGDFLQLYPELIKSVDYYLDGIKEIEKKKQIDNILVVSDDIPWCKENFKDNRNIFIEEEDYLQLYLMTLCENNIITASLFSWWGAFLNRNENKIVIRPIESQWP